MQGRRPLAGPVRRLKHAATAVAVITVLYYLGWLAVGEALLLRSLIHCLGYIITCALHAQTVMQQLLAGTRWVVSSPLGAAVYDQMTASAAWCTIE